MMIDDSQQEAFRKAAQVLRGGNVAAEATPEAQEMSKPSIPKATKFNFSPEAIKGAAGAMKQEYDHPDFNNPKLAEILGKPDMQQAYKGYSDIIMNGLSKMPLDADPNKYLEDLMNSKEALAALEKLGAVAQQYGLSGDTEHLTAIYGKATQIMQEKGQSPEQPVQQQQGGRNL